DFQQAGGEFSDRPQQRKAGKLDQRDYYSETLVKKFHGALLFGRRVVHPEENQSHLIEPQYAGQVDVQVFRDAHFSALDSAGEKSDVLVANTARLLTEWGKRMVRIDVGGERSHQLAIRREILE